MMLKFNVLTIITLNVLSYGIIAEINSCEKWKSVKLDKSQRVTDIIHGEVTSGLDETFIDSGDSIKNCPCNKHPCLRKCCQHNQIYHKKVNGSVECISNTFGINVINRISSNITKKIIIENNMTIVSHELQQYCKKNGSMYPLEDDDYILLPNGSIMNPYNNDLVTIDNYCFEFLYEGNVSYFLMCTPVPQTEDVMIEPTDMSIINKQVANGQDNNKIQLDYYPYFMIISLPFLIATFLLYVFISDLNNLVGKCLSSMAVCMTISFILLILLMKAGDSKFAKVICKQIAYITEFSLLSSFFWLNIMCFDMWAVFSGFTAPYRSLTKQQEIAKYIKYAIYAWGSPVIICVVIYIVDERLNLPEDSEFKPGMGSDYCILNENTSRLIFFYLPLTILLILNISFFLATVKKIYSHGRQLRVLRCDGNKVNRLERERLNLYFKLFLVMGLSWISEPLSKYFNQKPFWFWFVLDAINMSQGIPIFVIFVCKRRTLRVIKKRLCPSLTFFSFGSESTNENQLQCNS